MSQPTEQDNAINAIFTQREQKIILFGLLTLDELPNINYAVVAQRMGMSNPRSVQNAWTIMKKKIREFDAANGGAAGIAPATTTAAPATPATPANGRKRTAAAIAANDGEGLTPTPTKSTGAKRARTKKAAIVQSPSVLKMLTGTGAVAKGSDTPTKARGRGRPRKNVAFAAVTTPSGAPIIGHDEQTAIFLRAKATTAAAATDENDDVAELIRQDDLSAIEAIIKREPGVGSSPLARNLFAAYEKAEADDVDADMAEEQETIEDGTI